MAGVQTAARLPDTGTQNLRSIGQHCSNPRRTPPRDSKSLPGHKRQKLSHSPEKIDPSLAPLIQLPSQGSGSDQSATGWFDSANKHVPQNAHRNPQYDDEPPFFMSNQTNYLQNTFAPSEGSKLFGVQSRIDSENEDLRGVIDDLTVENKKLKQILRLNQRSQRNSPSTDGQDKLFEVRMHGLPSEKRRELEFLLKNFATSVHNSVVSVPNSNAGSGVSSTNLKDQYAGRAKTDSGYASNSNSGQPYLASNTPRYKPVAPQSTMDKSINKYLHDIPDTLLPRQQPIVMSERARMALVVRRLEQLFTGRNAAPGEHSQPLQQQEVSQMAARADATTTRKRKIEGSREAHILPPDTKVNFDAVDSGPEKTKRPSLKASDSDTSTPDGSGSVISRPGSPDQRPTRPLDLDIHRAQVAAENIEYIRHLGLSSPHLDSNESNEPWMFLNLLINMAQMHTINVTPEFVRRSIKKLSTKFELSKDGHRVRWIGGPEGTIFSKEEEKALEVVDSNKDNSSPDDSNEDMGTSGSSSKRSKTDTNSNAMASNTTKSEDKTSGVQTTVTSKQQISTGATSNLLSPPRTGKTQSGSMFDYKPIVYRERRRDYQMEESYLQDSDSSLEDTSPDSSGLAHALSKSNLHQQRKSDEGLITFYNNPFFCSDYSGEKMPPNMLLARDAEHGSVLGIHPHDDVEGQASRLASACYFTPQYGPAPFRSSQNEVFPSFEVAPLSMDGSSEIQPLEFQVSGLSGVVPEDNFAVDVDVYRVESTSRTDPRANRTIAFTGTQIKPNYVYRLGGSHKLDLLPSRLPPPSYVIFTSSSSSGNHGEDDDDESSDTSDESSSSSDVEELTNPAFVRTWSSEEFGDVDGDDDGDQDDSSVDMLAAARAADPVRIAEQERQYVINQPGGRAIAGSLAATVGASRSSSSAGDSVSGRAQADSESEDGSDRDSDMDVDAE